MISLYFEVIEIVILFMSFKITKLIVFNADYFT